MSLVRNLTRRARGQTRGEESTNLPRSCTVRYQPGTINRAKISLPTALLSTTNVDALNAPDIQKGAALSSTASSSSDSVHSDSDFASIDKGFLSTNNSSSSELSPLTPLTPISDFDNKDFFSSKPTTGPSLSAEPTPAIPQRAASHSKKAHVELSKQMSIKRSLSPPPATISESTASRDTLAMFSTPTQESVAASSPASHPFSKELAKVDELAEGFGSGLVLDEEEQEMMAKGLQKFSVDDYVAELTGLHGGVFEDKLSLNPWM